MSATVCWEIHFRGHVQGVGFRFTTARLATGFQVTGTVENLADGRVRLVVEGEPDELERFVGAVRAEFAAEIRGEDRAERPAGGRFAEFTIRR